MSFTALRVSEPSVVSTESTSWRLLSPALALAFSYFGFLHIGSNKKGMPLKTSPIRITSALQIRRVQ